MSTMFRAAMKCRILLKFVSSRRGGRGHGRGLTLAKPLHSTHIVGVSLERKESPGQLRHKTMVRSHGRNRQTPRVPARKCDWSALETRVHVRIGRVDRPGERRL